MRDGVFFSVEGVFCPCGRRGLVIAIPGSDPVLSEHGGITLTRGTPTRGWCSVEHARAAGWPWLRADRQRAKKAPRTEPGTEAAAG